MVLPLGRLVRIEEEACFGHVGIITPFSSVSSVRLSKFIEPKSHLPPSTCSCHGDPKTSRHSRGSCPGTSPAVSTCNTRAPKTSFKCARHRKIMFAHCVNGYMYKHFLVTGRITWPSLSTRIHSSALPDPMCSHLNSIERHNIFAMDS